MHEDLPVSFAVVSMMNFFGPGSSASSIFDGDVVFFGPFVTMFSPVLVTLNLWRSNLDAIIVLLVVTDGMGLVVTSTTPHGGDVIIRFSADFHTMPFLALIWVLIMAWSVLESGDSVMVSISFHKNNLFSGTSSAHAVALGGEVDGNGHKKVLFFNYLIN